MRCSYNLFGTIECDEAMLDIQWITQRSTVPINQIASIKSDFECTGGWMLLAIICIWSGFLHVYPYVLFPIGAISILLSLRYPVVIRTTSGHHITIPFFLIAIRKAKRVRKYIEEVVRRRYYNTDVAAQTDRIINWKNEQN